MGKGEGQGGGSVSAEINAADSYDMPGETGVHGWSGPMPSCTAIQNVLRLFILQSQSPEDPTPLR